MQRQWNVTIKGQSWPRLVTGERVDVTPEWVTFVDEAGEVVLLVHERDLVLVERYEEPPF